MSRHLVIVVGHPSMTVELPGEITFDPPVAPDQARVSIALSVAQAVRPHLHHQPPTKQVVRDAGGHISEIQDHPAASRDVLAALVGWRIAGELLGADE